MYRHRQRQRERELINRYTDSMKFISRTCDGSGEEGFGESENPLLIFFLSLFQLFTFRNLYIYIYLYIDIYTGVNIQYTHIYIHIHRINPINNMCKIHYRNLIFIKREEEKRSLITCTQYIYIYIYIKYKI